jgi:iron(III) transport system substrate-binding protein
MRRAVALGSVLLLLFSALGCAFATSRPAGRSTSGTLIVLGTAEEAFVRGMCQAFELETGIKTEYVRMSAGEALNLLRESRGAPRFSVWWGGPADGYITANSEGLLEPYKPRGSAMIPRQYKDTQGAWTGIYVGALGFAVNKKVLAAEGLPVPGSWADLLAPQYRGRIAIAHPASSGTAYTAIATIVQLHAKDYERGFAYLEALHRNVAAYPRAGAEPARMAGRGEVAVGIAFSHDIVATIEDGYEELTVVFPAEGTGYEIGGMALIKNAPEPVLAKRFMDWALSRQAQEFAPLFRAYQIPTNPDAKVPQKSVRLSSVRTINYDFRWSGDNREALIARFSRTIAPLPTERAVRKMS